MADTVQITVNISRAFRARIAALWPKRHSGRRSELRTLVQALRAIEREG